jgi:hypothetical protein
MSRTGKIARLPHAIRQQLNLQTQDGVPETKLVEWLNSLPEAQCVLDEQFGGRPITERNLSEWKQRGFQEWLRLQETQEWLDQMREEGADLEAITESGNPVEWLSAPLAIALYRSLQAATDAGFDTPAKRREILKIAREISRLRGRDHQAARFRLRQEQAEAKLIQERKASGSPEMPHASFAATPGTQAAPADRSRPDQKSHPVPSVRLVPFDRVPAQTNAPDQLNQAKSNQIQPNKNPSALKPAEAEHTAPAPVPTAELISPIGPIRPIRPIRPILNAAAQTEATLPSHRFSLNPTKSDQIQPPSALNPNTHLPKAA